MQSNKKVMDRFLCQLCNKIVTFGEIHQCIANKNINTVCIQPEIDKFDQFNSNDEALSGHSVKFEDDNRLLLQRNSRISEMDLEQSQNEENYLLSKRTKSIKLHKWKKEEKSFNEATSKESQLSKSIEVVEKKVHSQSMSGLQGTKLILEPEMDKPGEHFKKVSHIPDESESLISGKTEPRTFDNRIDIVAGPSNEKNVSQGTFGKKINLCGTCGAGFTDKQDLDSHCLTHKRHDQLPCNFCGKQFRFPSLLERHLRTHTGEKPFNCDVCNKTFNRKDNLVKHFRKHTSNKTFVCKICGRGFVDLSILKRHVCIHWK